jgi:peptidoglycan/xylan/chitin deacetylase (PgdA/CDA1 family)
MSAEIRMRALLLPLLIALQACGTAPPRNSVERARAPAAQAAHAGRPSVELARDDSFVIVVAGTRDDLASLAQRYLGDARKAWWIAEFNNIEAVRPGQDVVIPLRPPNPWGVTALGYQTVPILCYHRFGPKQSRLTTSAADFAAQMEYLATHGYRVVPLAQLVRFIEGKEALPPRSVVITIDDGYASTYDVAFPILAKFGFPATVFLYSDFVGAPDALTWPQMQEMAQSGLIEIQPHSKTHANLALRLPQEDEARYRERLAQEVAAPVRVIRERMGRDIFSFAYPYGDVTVALAEQIGRNDIRLGLTVTPGANPFFAAPLMLRRTMIFGDDDLAAFKAKLVTFAPVPPR